ncbi:hypothetical protein E3T61_00460 [Cryobacterium lactosi]|jgi:hypothetical protein|uniref:Type IV secretion protein Rhs n=1 Tax=Cryobacterium lactosi TaxID=1259202 RepID=A0A4R9C1P4_9MICO|nr:MULTISPECIES: hypothetical protein [Cryobacterium]RZI35622.1 hypothetical protein BJQ95_01993 [Cryobacterium sp. SO1]TFD95145.1 hypothetical protein E3T61_00460 [Cryobacterium lactosi]
MTSAKKRKPTIKEAGGFTAWLNGRLLPFIGPPPLGPYDDEVPVQERPVARCPLCGEPMTEHDIDRSGERTQLRCPLPAPTA